MNVFYRLLRSCVKTALRLYFAEVRIEGQPVPAGPVVWAANHQNAFLDALLIVCFIDKPVYFLTRADIFKAPWTGALKFLGMIPVYRVRDGFRQIASNHTSFDACRKVLEGGASVALFPEGNHGSFRRVRPLSRGFTRIAEGLTASPVPVVPLGINFSHPRRFLSRVSLIVGEPLLLQPGTASSLTLAAAATEELESRLKKVVVHIPDYLDHAAALRWLNASGKDLTKPDSIESLPQALTAQSPGTANRTSSHIAAIFHAPLLIFWREFARKIKDPVFISSARFVCGLVLLPVYYSIIFVLLAAFAGWGISLLVILLMFISLRFRL